MDKELRRKFLPFN